MSVGPKHPDVDCGVGRWPPPISGQYNEPIKLPLLHAQFTGEQDISRVIPYAELAVVCLALAVLSKPVDDPAVGVDVPVCGHCGNQH